MSINHIPSNLSNLLQTYCFIHTEYEYTDTDVYEQTFVSTPIRLIILPNNISLYIDHTIEIEHAPINEQNIELIINTITDILYQLGFIKPS